MRWEELIWNKKYKMRGQTLVELLIAMGIFVIIVSGFAFFVLDSYVSGHLAQEITIANFLSQEGIEATKSIRDHSWNNLASGSHGLIISGNTWVFQGIQEDLSSQLKGGIREIIVEDIDSDRKKVTSRVIWEFLPSRTQTSSMVTYFTNWEKTTPYVKQLRYRWRNDDGGE